MTGLLSALAVFVALHSIPAVPDIRSRVIWVVGRSAYLTLYSAASIGALVWLFSQALDMDYVELWDTAAWQVQATFVCAPVGLFFVVSGLLSANPFSVTMRRDDFTPGAIVSVTRHPVLIGFVLWSFGHVLPNGNLRSLILFGGSPRSRRLAF
jgi:uncharacterized membrane protein